MLLPGVVVEDEQVRGRRALGVQDDVLHPAHQNRK
jgi:hypothetical protein